MIKFALGVLILLSIPVMYIIALIDMIKKYRNSLSFDIMSIGIPAMIVIGVLVWSSYFEHKKERK